MNRTGIKKMLTTTVLTAMAVLLVFSASAVCDTVVPVEVDIKPDSDENPVNVKSNGVLPVAVLGNDTLDVMDINQTTIRLNGTVLNETCAPIRCSYEDVDGDGYMDLVLKFKTQEVVECLAGSCDEDIVTLTLTAELYDETEIAGSDGVRVLKKGKGK